MKYYVTVTSRRVIEVDEETYEAALIASEQQVNTLLVEPDAWKTQIEVSAVRGLGENRYYVALTENSYQVRERQVESHQPDDPVIRSFGDDQESAHYYARSMSEVQRKLDRRYGRWVKHAVTPQTTEKNP